MHCNPLAGRPVRIDRQLCDNPAAAACSDRPSSSIPAHLQACEYRQQVDLLQGELPVGHHLLQQAGAQLISSRPNTLVDADCALQHLAAGGDEKHRGSYALRVEMSPKVHQ